MLWGCDQGCPGNTGAPRTVFTGRYFPAVFPALSNTPLGNNLYFNYSIIFHSHKFRDSRIYAACLPFISHIHDIVNMFHTGSFRVHIHVFYIINE